MPIISTGIIITFKGRFSE